MSGATKRRTFFVLAAVSAAASVAVFAAGVSGGFTGAGRGTNGEASTGYFVGTLVAMLLAGVFTWLGLSAKSGEP